MDLIYQVGHCQWSPQHSSIITPFVWRKVTKNSSCHWWRTVDPAFWTMCSHSMAWLAFFGENLIFFLKDLKLSLLFVSFFLKGKQNKKENPKCDSLFRKDNLWKTKIGSEDQITYWEGMVVSRSTPLNPIIRSLLNKVRQVWQLIRKSMNTNEIIK